MPGRDSHRDRHWRDRGTDQCPGCGRDFDATDRVDVHHNDENANNGNPDNTRTRCKTCHLGGEHGRDIDTGRQPTPSGTSPRGPRSTSPGR